MVRLNEPLIKELIATGDVTTAGKSGVLHQVVFTGATVGDKLEIDDGGTTRITLITSVVNEPVTWELPKDFRPLWETDIGATITKTGDAFATFIYEEIEE